MRREATVIGCVARCYLQLANVNQVNPNIAYTWESHHRRAHRRCAMRIVLITIWFELFSQCAKVLLIFIDSLAIGLLDMRLLVGDAA